MFIAKEQRVPFQLSITRLGGILSIAPWELRTFCLRHDNILFINRHYHSNSHKGSQV